MGFSGQQRKVASVPSPTQAAGAVSVGNSYTSIPSCSAGASSRSRIWPRPGLVQSLMKVAFTPYRIALNCDRDGMWPENPQNISLAL